jgi:hypothetical protein
MEYANAAITIGGKIKRSDVEKLARAIEADNAGADWTDTLDAIEAANEIEDCAKARRHLSLCSTDHPWGRFANVEAACGELGLIYVAECEAGGEWHPMLQYHSSDMDADTVLEWPITEIGRGPLLDAEDIQKHLDAGTLADELALMVQVHKFPWPLEIIENER